MSLQGSVALFIEKQDWHARRLLAAFDAAGVEARAVPLKDCGFDSAAPHGLILPGFAEALPAAALVRCVPGGSFEAVTLRLGVLHALRELGVTVWNDARAVERCVDKSMTSFLMQRAGMPTPDTWVVESREAAEDLVRREAGPGAPLVLKPLFGSQGRGLRLVERREDLPESEEIAGVYYLQRYVGPLERGWCDRRLFVAGGRVLAAMRRDGSGWITNAHQGAACAAIRPDEREAALAVAAVACVGAGYAGVDVITDRRGESLVLEVNSMPAWSALQKVAAIDVTGALVEAFLGTLEGRIDAGPLALQAASNTG